MIDHTGVAVRDFEKSKARAAVDAFYSAALAAGGRSNGEPGLRPHYHAGACVLDFDDHNIEVVCHEPVA